MPEIMSDFEEQENNIREASGEGQGTVLLRDQGRLPHGDNVRT